MLWERLLGMVSQMTGESFDRLVNHIRKEKRPSVKALCARMAGCTMASKGTLSRSQRTPT